MAPATDVQARDEQDGDHAEAAYVAMIMGHDQERFLATPAEGFVGAEPLLCRAP